MTVTQTETLIQTLQREVALLKANGESLRSELEPLDEHTKQIADITKQIAVIEHRLNEIAKASDTWSNRGWTLLMVCITCILSIGAGVITSMASASLRASK